MQKSKILSLKLKSNLVIVSSDYKEDQFEKGLSICIPGTIGHKIDIDIDDSYTLIAKTDHSCFSSEDFKLYLKAKSIDRLVLCGFLAEYCVNKTAIDALEQGYDVSLLKDCIGTGDDVQDRREKVFSDLSDKGVKVIDLNLYLQQLRNT